MINDEHCSLRRRTLLTGFAVLGAGAVFGGTQVMAMVSPAGSSVAPQAWKFQAQTNPC